MSIISGFETVKEYIKKSDGYKTISRWTSSHTVEMDSGNTLEEEISNIGKGVELTQEEYNNLTEEEKNNDTIYYIKDGDTSLPVVLLTKSEYDNIGDSVNNDGKIYLVTDDDYNASSKDVFYDNANSNLESTNVQDAIDEIDNNLTNINICDYSKGIEVPISSLPYTVENNSLMVVSRFRSTDTNNVFIRINGENIISSNDNRIYASGSYPVSQGDIISLSHTTVDEVTRIKFYEYKK